MATSSIFANVIISSEESAAAIADAFEAFEANGTHREITSKPTLEPEKIKAFFSEEDNTQ